MPKQNITPCTLGMQHCLHYVMQVSCCSYIHDFLVNTAIPMKFGLCESHAFTQLHYFPQENGSQKSTLIFVTLSMGMLLNKIE